MHQPNAQRHTGEPGANPHRIDGDIISVGLRITGNARQRDAHPGHHKNPLVCQRLQ